MGKFIALLICIGIGLLFRSFMYSNSGMGLLGGLILLIGIVLLVVEARKV
jgi:hypothetical protein